ncbi:AsnC family transcriptional regulator [Gluconobacter kondonii]|nr:Lrp/AsnC family transcriptional regulator [Gluconobacter kondonii]MBS1066856.1 Lrp/AsnC family transcriptional regulator [Gluconobacter kondonii]
MIKLDQIDRTILQVLQADGRLSNSDLERFRFNLVHIQRL